MWFQSYNTSLRELKDHEQHLLKQQVCKISTVLNWNGNAFVSLLLLLASLLLLPAIMEEPGEQMHCRLCINCNGTGQWVCVCGGGGRCNLPAPLPLAGSVIIYAKTTGALFSRFFHAGHLTVICIFVAADSLTPLLLLAQVLLAAPMLLSASTLFQSSLLLLVSHCYCVPVVSTVLAFYCTVAQVHTLAIVSPVVGPLLFLVPLIFL